MKLFSKYCNYHDPCHSNTALCTASRGKKAEVIEADVQNDACVSRNGLCLNVFVTKKRQENKNVKTLKSVNVGLHLSLK